MQFARGPTTSTSKCRTCRTAAGAPKTFHSFPGESQLSKDILGHALNTLNLGLSEGNCNHTMWSTYSQRPSTSPVSSVSSRSENHTTYMSLCATPHTHTHVHAHTHVHTHCDNSAQSNRAGEKDQKLCQERNMIKRNN